MFSLNDKVKFLDEEGGGIITKIIDHLMVEVTTFDGFSFPYRIRDLIKIEDTSPIDKLLNKEIKMPEVADIQKPQPQKKTNILESHPLVVDKNKVRKEHYALYLSFVPREQYRLIFGSFDLFFQNVSDKVVQFVVYRALDTGFELVKSGRINPFSSIRFGEIERDDLNQWERLVFQMMLIEEKSHQLRGPVDTLLRVKGNRFFSENSYIRTDFSKDKAVVFEVVKIDSIPFLHEMGIEQKATNQQIVKTETQQKANNLILEYQTDKGKAEVDIHIWKLTNDELSMSAHEKFLTQMDYFKRCLDSAIEHRFTEVVFIHGVGSGRLKEEIKSYLEEREIEHKPASMSEYGLGAIEVKIKN